jgi:hypothetical protein
MKKLSIKRLRRKQSDTTPSRITNETVAEHREQILAGGRKFKYPIQYTRHKLVINALLVIIGATVLLLVVGWWQLYIMQNSSTFIYRVTRIVPVPVAVVNGEQVNFSDYLVQYRGSEYYLSKYDEIKLQSADGQRQLAYIKRESLNKAIAYAYAKQIARQRGISVSSKDIDDVVDQQRNTVNGRISQETYDASSQMVYGWSPADYRLAIEQGIVRTRAAFAVDVDAQKQAEKAAPLVVSTGGDFAKVAEQLIGMPGGKPVVGQTGLVSNTGVSGGLQVAAVAKLDKGQVSGLIRSNTDDGYYYVKVIDKNDTQVSFSYLHIPLVQFAKDLDGLKKSGKITEYISIEEKK